MLSRTELARRRRVLAIRIRETVAARRLALLPEPPSGVDGSSGTPPGPSASRPAA